MPVRMRFRRRSGGLFVRVELGLGFCLRLCSFRGLRVRIFGVCFQRGGFRNLGLSFRRVGFCGFGKCFERAVA